MELNMENSIVQIDQPKIRNQAGYFKTKYYSNPEYKQKHLERCTKLTQCECGNNIQYANLGRHRKSKIHKSKMEAQEKADLKD